MIEVLICTFRRPQIRQTLESIRAAYVPDGVGVRVIVVDNDDTPSARPAIEDLFDDPSFPLKYVHAPGRNISIARNGALDAASADWIAFIDDDEVAKEDWLLQLWARQKETGVDGVFGLTQSVFPPEAPKWMGELNLHAPGPQRTGGETKSGSTGNSLLRWQGTAWFDERFDLARGKTGGEDTEFFYRIGRLGAVFEIASHAVVLEPVPESRQSLRWLKRRRFRAGQTYAVSALGGVERAQLGLRASAKSVLSFVTVVPMLWHPTKWRYWYLRGVFHAGVVAGCLNIRQAELYG